MAERSSSGDVLMTITEEQLETGLRGYPVGYCVTSSVDPQQGLFYQGYPVAELADWEPEEVIYLLWHGQKGDREEISAFSLEIEKRAHLSKELEQQIALLPRKGNPMKLLSIALLLTGMLEGKNNYREDALDLVAKIPLVVAKLIRHHAGWEGVFENRPELGYIENFAQLLSPPGMKGEELTRLFKIFNILHYDHGGGNLSAFTGKAVSSGLEDLYGSIAAAMSALAGPRHGRANQDSLHFLEGFVARLGPEASLEEVEKEVRSIVEQHGLLFGFGHAVLRVEDPRATLFYRIGQEQYGKDPLISMALKLRQVVPPILLEGSRVADPYPNVDAISGALLSAAGFPYPAYFTLLFGLARCVGIARQIIYERCEARQGKGVPIYRPKFFKKELKKS